MKIPLSLTPEQLHRLGRSLVRFIEEEARKEFAKQRHNIDPKMGLPDTEDFFKSFSYSISANEILLESTWPWIDRLLEGRGEYDMKWLRSLHSDPKIVPLRERGTGKIIFRMAPLTTESAWVHPGVAKHTFFERAKARLRKELRAILFQEVVGPLLVRSMRGE